MKKELTTYHSQKAERCPQQERSLKRKILQREFKLRIGADSEEEANLTKLEILLKNNV
jgi:hypothetical protein